MNFSHIHSKYRSPVPARPEQGRDARGPQRELYPTGLVNAAFLFSLITIFILTGCVTTGGGASSQAQPGGPSFETITPKAFAGKNEVLIGGFKVTFITQQKGTRVNRGSFLGGGGGMARASANVVLDGISPQLMQSITDTAYERFVAGLQKEGYTVRSRDLLKDNAAFQAVKTEASPFETSEPMPAFKAEGQIFAPSGQVLRLMAWQGAGLEGFAWSSPEAGFSKASVELGIPVIDVHYLVHFANFDGHSSRSTASISVDQGIAVLQSSQIGITSGYGGTFSTDQGRLILGTPITVGDSFATIEKQEESALNKAGQVLAVGVAVLLGGGTRSLDTFVYRSDPEKYQAAVLAALDRANQGFVARMVSLR